MANLVSSTIPNLIQGTSLQPDSSRDPSQGDEQINGMSSLAEGLRKREGTECIKKISDADLGDVYMHQILRDSGEKYLVVISKTSIKVFDLDGNEKGVDEATGAFDYLSTIDNDAKTKIRAATIADYTFISNTKIKPALTTDTAPIIARTKKHEALVWVKAGNYGQKYICNINGQEVSIQTAVAPVVVIDGQTIENRISTADIAARLMNAFYPGSINTGGTLTTTEYLTNANPTVVTQTTTATDTATTTDGEGTGLKLDLVLDGSAITGITVTSGDDHGSNYVIGDKIYVPGTVLGGSDSISTSPKTDATDYLTNQNPSGVTKTETTNGTVTTTNGTGTGLKLDLTMDGSALTGIAIDANQNGSGYAIGNKIYVKSDVLDGRSDSINTSPAKETTDYLTIENPTVSQTASFRQLTTTDNDGTGLKVDIETDGSAITSLLVADSSDADHGTGYAVGDKIYVPKNILEGGNDTTAVHIATVKKVDPATDVHIATVKKVDPLITTPVHIATVKKVVEAAAGFINGQEISITRNKSVLHVTSDTAITIAAEDARANADITCITSEVQVFTELPTIAPKGYQIKILGDPSNSFDNYHVEFVPRTGADEFGEGAWQECVSPGEYYKINKATMPHLLIRKPDQRFYFGPADGEFLYGRQVISVSLPSNVVDFTLSGVTEVSDVATSTDGSGSGLIIKKLIKHETDAKLGSIELYDDNNESKQGLNYQVGDQIRVLKNVLVNTTDTTTTVHVATVTAIRELNRPQWGERTCGDTDSAPNPSFIGNPIQDVFIYKNRLGFLADENIILSRAKSFFDFFPETVTTLLDSDPIDLQASNTKVSILRYAIPYQDELIIFSDQIQFRFNASETILTPSTAVITVLTQFELDINCRPMPVAGTIIFAQANGIWSSFREFSVKGAGSALVADASDLTSYVNSYIPSEVFRITSNDTGNSWFTLSSKAGFEDRIYVYKYFYRNTGSGAERAQSSWSYWELNGADKILQILCVEETLYLINQYSNNGSIEIWLEKMPVADRLSDVSPSPYPFLLDRRISTTNKTAITVGAGTYSAATKQTTWTLPFTIVKETQAWSGFNKTTDGAVYLGTASSGTEITAEGDWSTSPIYFGEVFDFTYRFTKFKLYKEIGGGKAPGNVERTQIRHAKLRYHQTRYFEIHVKPERRDTAVYKFDGTILRVRDSTLGNVLPATGYDREDDRYFEGVFRIPINSKGENCVIEIHNKTIHPCKFSTCEWVGLITSQARSMQ